MRRILEDRPLTGPEHDRRFRSLHREQRAAESRAYHAAHPEVGRASQARAYAADPEKYRERKRAAYAADPTRRRAYKAAWRAANPDKVRLESSRHRAHKMNAFVEDVTVERLLEMSGGACGICLAIIAPGEESVDHIIPLSRGGEHSYRNTQAAHLLCNLRKGVS